MAMLRHKFLYSEKEGDRMKRHLLFWTVALIYVEAIDVMNASRITAGFFLVSILSNIFILLPSLFLVYALLYFVLPRFFINKNYVEAFCLTAVLVFIGASARAMITQYVTNDLIPFVMSYDVPFSYRSSYDYKMSPMYVLFNVVLFAPMAIAIRLIKQWYLKEQRNLELEKENSKAQLQLLTAQVHPHFLFNTLNKIWSKAQAESPSSAKMIMGLSHILHFVLEEGKHGLVPLEKELQMLTDYINLEKIRYDHRLSLHVSMPSEAKDVYIAPLLILPFVENSFKHGSSKMLQEPWMNLKIEVKNNLFSMKLMNGKKSSSDQFNRRKGSGIVNARKRLDLLYKNRYVLQVDEDKEVFVVNLTMELVGIEKPSSVESGSFPIAGA